MPSRTVQHHDNAVIGVSCRHLIEEQLHTIAIDVRQDKGVQLYTTKTPITTADLLNDLELPFFAEQGMGIVRILTDRSTEYCGKPESHDYQLYLALNDIEHTKTKVRHPQTNGICERFHKTILQEFYQVAFRRKIYRSIEELQADLDSWVAECSNDRPHQGKMGCGRTPMQTLIDGREVWHDKITTLNS